MYKILIIPGGHEGMYFEDQQFTSGSDALIYAMENITSAFQIVKLITFVEES